MFDAMTALYISISLAAILLVINWVILCCLVCQSHESNNQMPGRLIKVTNLITCLRNKFQSIECKRKELEERINQLSPYNPNMSE